MGCGFGAGLEPAGGRFGEKRVSGRSAITAVVDGVHDGEGTADAEGEAQKEPDQGGRGEAHLRLWYAAGFRAACSQRVEVAAGGAVKSLSAFFTV